MLSKRVNDAIKSGLKRTLSALESKLANPIDGFRNSVDSALAESLRSNYTTTNGSEPSGSRANHGVEVNASNMMSSKLTLRDFPILSRSVAEFIQETPPPKKDITDNHRTTLFLVYFI